MSEKTFILVAGAAIVAAIWWDSRNKRPVATVTASGAPQQSYSTPTAIGELLARSINALTRNVVGPAPKGVTPENAQDAFVRAELQAQRAATGWSGPSQSRVYTDDPNERWSVSNDADISAPVYDRAEQLVQNPFLLAAL